MHHLLPGGVPGGAARGALGVIITESGPWLKSQIDAQAVGTLAQAGQFVEIVVYNGAGMAAASAVVHVGQLMQKLKAIEQSAIDGHWHVAPFLEVRSAGEEGLATQNGLRGAAKRQLVETRLRNSTSKQPEVSP